MNRTDINRYLTNPELVANASSEELRRLVETYPYCEALHWIYLRALYVADDAMFEEELMLHGMHISNRRLFYNYLTVETQYIASPHSKEAPNKIETQYIASLPTTDYFALDDNPAQKQTLQQLAAQLKAARLARQKQSTQSRDAASCVQTSEASKTTDIHNTYIETQHTASSPKQPITIPSQPIEEPQITEEYAKKLIKEQKYLEAIEILRAISLNNPKKSANFALQIKFLETIINNHNKN
ncbi:MAG: hypothetical protein J6A44_00205 [Paludibacteraceae bacterium]|nr:hypothetical protein [Paludibacteraceae bacterium]